MNKTSPNYELWQYLEKEHALICTETELEEIKSIVFAEIYTLKPCPFCTSLDLRIKLNKHNDDDLYCVICMNCKTEGPIGKSKEYARYRWNVRRLLDGNGIAMPGGNE